LAGRTVGFVDSPRLVCRLGMLSQSLLQLRAVILHPAPNRGVVDIETTLLQQLLNIAQRERIAKIPSDRTKDDVWFGLPPFEDRRSPASNPESCNTSISADTCGSADRKINFLVDKFLRHGLFLRLFRRERRMPSREICPKHSRARWH